MTDKQKEQIRKLRGKGASYTAISKKLKISANSVKSFCRRDISTAEEDDESFTNGGCENCGRPVNQIEGRKKKRFCCDKCRIKWWNSHLDLVNRKSVHSLVCPNCRCEFKYYGNAPRKYCSHKCYIAYRYKGEIINGE